MNDYVDCNLSREVLDTMLIAQKISKEFQEREITALDFFLASLEYSDTSLLELIVEAQKVGIAESAGISTINNISCVFVAVTRN